MPYYVLWTDMPLGVNAVQHDKFVALWRWLELQTHIIEGRELDYYDELELQVHKRIIPHVYLVVDIVEYYIIYKIL